MLRVSEGTVRALARREGLPLVRVSARRYLGDPDPSTRQRAALGESASRFPRLVQDAEGRNGSTGQRRPPVASSRPSSVVSLGASPRKKAG